MSTETDKHLLQLLDSWTPAKTASSKYDDGRPSLLFPQSLAPEFLPRRVFCRRSDREVCGAPNVSPPL